MKALQISKHGVPAEVVELADIPEPDAPKANEVLVAVEYAPINQSEQLKIMGRYPVLPTSFPTGLGNEGVARILSVGGGVAGLKPGDRVLVPATHSAWRERILLPAAGLVALPASADPQQLSMLSINPPTAALLLVRYSFTSGKPGVANGIDLIFRGTTIRGFWLYSPLFRGSAKIGEGIKLGAQLVAEGKLSVPVVATYPLSSAAAALAHAQKGGKVLFQVA